VAIERDAHLPELAVVPLRPEAGEGGRRVTVDTKRFDIEPVLGEALPEAAAFLERWRVEPNAAWSPSPAERAGSPTMLRRLQWLLLEHPLAAGVGEHGLCVRDGAGAIVGLLLSFPSAFRMGDRRILTMASGSYFVEPRARTLGFYLFKRHLTCPGYAFFFSTTCNATSSAMWTMLGAEAVAHSDTEHVLPLDLEVMLPEFLAGRAAGAWTAGLARVAGRGANAVWRRIVRRSAHLIAEPCRDWEKLAALASRHRPPEWITTDRSPAFLQWRYGPGSPTHAAEIGVLRDRRGHEGWFALGTTVRGHRGQIRGYVLLDAAWPRDTMGFDDVLAAAARFVASRAHAIYVRPRPGVDHRVGGRWIARRRREPSVFAIPGKGRGREALSSLDLVVADGDGGLTYSGSW